MDKKKILVIEDDNILQDAIKIALEKDGYKVMQSFEGKDGLKKMESDKPDLVLLDLMLPEKDGYHLLHEAKENERIKDIPVVVLTAIGTETSTEECLAFGAKDYIVKSEYSLEDVVEKVKENLK